MSEGLLSRRPWFQFLRFALVGIASNLAGYLIYLAITELGLAPKLAMTVLYVVGVVIGFSANRTYTFAHSGNLLSSGWRYLISYGVGYLIALTIQIGVVDVLGYPHQLAQGIALLVVAVCMFVMLKFFVFRRPIT
ncbi:GtrA family protein [Pseudomonas sp. NPDC089554]|uniref:GtrA family protein n=1 Tax=Pseudomonas sp. NPDC089554 TaxID=3390653 RepID=UPI003CFE50DA